ncbi:hypothetical protein SADUNF_Sadunf04G0146700 [Salix dunnii]|uniref:EF-hand domain-containing protein n=1 Tax=Salix dunnii TaxID=1413687 RepID=A0A835N166_9ROSI|nr:hypothetical protein SADUNF_Sadunf04G0146700 [Salix dunnii]
MENKTTLREWFERVDSEKTGNITATQLKSALAVGNLEFPLSVVQQMIRMYDSDRNGTMSFDEFVGLNKFLVKVCAWIMNCFRKFNRHSRISRGKFSALCDMKMVGSDSGHHIVLYLIALWSLFSNKIFRIHVLIATLSFFGCTKSELLKFDARVIVYISAIMSRGRGYLVPDDVYEGLVKTGFSLDSPSFYTVCESFDRNKNGRIHLDDFISLCIFVQSARNLFNSFDTTKQGRVTLDFNQFVYFTANCRI